MGSSISWVLAGTINDGQLDNFKALMNDMVPSTEAEAGAESYEFFISDDQGTVHIYERYADNAATMVHLGIFGANFAERFMGAFTPTNLDVYGEVDDTVREALAGLGAKHFATLGGFAR